MADKINGWLRPRERADGMTWLWCYQRLRPSDGKMVENSVRLGLITDIGDESAAWRRVGELGLVEKYISESLSGKPSFGDLCRAYVKDGLPFRKKDGRRKGKGTIETYQYHINNLILPRWEDVIAEEMKPLAIRNWLYDLHDGHDYRWETCSKTAGIMSLVFSFVDHNEIYSIRNLMEKVTIPASEGRTSGTQTTFARRGLQPDGAASQSGEHRRAAGRGHWSSNLGVPWASLASRQVGRKQNLH
jgi:hypothetical protein